MTGLSRWRTLDFVRVKLPTQNTAKYELPQKGLMPRAAGKTDPQVAPGQTSSISLKDGPEKQYPRSDAF